MVAIGPDTENATVKLVYEVLGDQLLKSPLNKIVQDTSILFCRKKRMSHLNLSMPHQEVTLYFILWRSYLSS